MASLSEKERDGMGRSLCLTLFSLVAVLLLAACGNLTAASPAEPVSPRPASNVPASARRLSVLLASDYAHRNWGSLRRYFKRGAVAGALVTEMRQWASEHVGGLRVTVVHSQPARPHRVVATFQFAADARAVPQYFVYVLDTSKQTATVLGNAPGIVGTNFENAKWVITRSRNFIVYHSPYMLAGTDRNVLSSLEYQRQEFQRKFGVKLPSPIAYYLYPDTGTMSRMTLHACGFHPENVGCANPYTDPPTVQTVLWPTYHEPIHVYQLSLEPKPHGQEVWVAPLFIAEGSAVALEDRTVDPRTSDYCSDLAYAPLAACARIALGHVRPITLLPDTGFGSVDPGYAYSLAGSFVSYLILHYGYHQFGRFYYQLAAQPKDSEADYNRATEAVYHRSIASLISSWTDWLRAQG